MFNKQCLMQKEGEGFLSEPDIINDLNSLRSGGNFIIVVWFH